MQLTRLACATSLALAACGNESTFDQASFSPQCQPGDLRCAGEGLDAPLAVGATLPLDVDLYVAAGGGPAATLESADPDVLAVDGVTLTGHAAGVVGLLLVQGPSGVLDFTHVAVSPADRVALVVPADDAELVEPIQLLVGDELELAPRPYQGARALLGVSPTTTWSVDGDGVTLLADGSPARRRLVARTPGTAQVAVEAFGFAATLDVEVLP